MDRMQTIFWKKRQKTIPKDKVGRCWPMPGMLHKTVPIVNGNVSIWRTKYLRAEVSH